MQAAMELGGENEVGVWVSDFYGSGKSSFTKYLGLALDSTVQIDGVPFLRHLQDRLQKPQTRALLSTVAQRFPAAVLLLDLASEQVAGATMEEGSTVLYYKVLQWAGYSRNLKVAAFERRLKKDGRSAEFHDLFRAQTGEAWQDYQNDELVVDSLLPDLAHQMYPMLFKTPTAFTTATSEVIYLLGDRVQEMIDIIRDATDKDYILFVIDERCTSSKTGFRCRLIWNRGISRKSVIADSSANRRPGPQRSIPNSNSMGRCYAIIRGSRTPGIMTRILAKRPLSTSIPSCRHTLIFCSTCSERWPNRPAGSAYGRPLKCFRTFWWKGPTAPGPLQTSPWAIWQPP
jgi:hypothetical protein